MKAEYRHIAVFQHRVSIAQSHAEGMCRVVDHLQSIGIRNVLDLLDRARYAVYVHRQDARSLRRNCRLDLLGIKIQANRIDIHEHWFDAVPHLARDCSPRNCMAW